MTYNASELEPNYSEAQNVYPLSACMCTNNVMYYDSFIMTCTAKVKLRLIIGTGAWTRL